MAHPVQSKKQQKNITLDNMAHNCLRPLIFQTHHISHATPEQLQHRMRAQSCAVSPLQIPVLFNPPCFIPSFISLFCLSHLNHQRQQKQLDKVFEFLSFGAVLSGRKRSKYSVSCTSTLWLISFITVFSLPCWSSHKKQGCALRCRWWVFLRRIQYHKSQILTAIHLLSSHLHDTTLRFLALTPTPLPSA